MLRVSRRDRVVEPTASIADRGMPLVATPMTPGCEMCVVIPARDEQEWIGDALRALVAQEDLDGSPFDPVRFEVIVLANNCVDNTAAVAMDVSRQFPDVKLHVVEKQFPSGTAHVGSARRTLMDEAASRFRVAGSCGAVIASTDADSRVDRFWVAQTLRAVRAGADAVGGRIIVSHDDRESFDRWSLSSHLRDVGYRMLVAELTGRIDPDRADPAPRHFQHFGPSLAVTVEAYGRAGGIPVRSSLEDVALYRALRRIDARIRHDPQVRVVTSARSSCRTSFGFSAQLRQWSCIGASGIPHLAPAPDAVVARARASRGLRALWRQSVTNGSIDRQLVQWVAADMSIDPERLRLLVTTSPTFGLLMERTERAFRLSDVWSARWPDVDIRYAIADLRERLAEIRGCDSVRDAFEQVDPVESLAGVI
jgi:hypothetical protein